MPITPSEPTVPTTPVEPTVPTTPVAPNAPVDPPAPAEPTTPLDSATWPPPSGQPAAAGSPAAVEPTVAPAPGDGAPVGEPALAPPPPPPAPKRKLGWLIAVILLGVGLLAAIAVLVLSLIRLSEAQELIGDQKDQIDEQEQIIDEKEVFSSAMANLMSTAHQFDGLPYSDIVPLDEFESLAGRGWDHRWNIDALAQDTLDANAKAEELNTVLATAQQEASTNVSGTNYESVIDQLGGGYVRSSMEDADAICESDVLGCVGWDDPYTVHFDYADGYHESMTDWIRTGVAYHEYAHVLQATNPVETAQAVEAFGGDYETMADCYAFAYLPGWTLDHTTYVSDFQYWEVHVGYGYVCDEAQRQVIRDWNDSLGFVAEPISQ